MTERERHIAETAIGRKQAVNYGVIQSEVATMTGLTADKVKKVLDHLVAEHIIHEKATPAWNVTEAPVPNNYQTWAWYEKGSMWRD